MGAVSVNSESEPDLDPLLEGLSGDERTARETLLERLLESGIPFEELRSAVLQGRLALVGVEHMLVGPEKYSISETADRLGLDPQWLVEQRKALGMVAADVDTPALSEEDLAAAERAKAFLDAGIPEEGVVELARLLAISMSQFAAANRQLIAGVFAGTDADEDQLSRRLEWLAQNLIPLVGPALEHVYRLHLREQLRHTALGFEERESGVAVEETVVAFADLVDFTRLGERLLPEELGAVTSRLDELARDVTAAPLRLVKLIGDAAMFSAPADAGEALVEALLELVARAAEEGDEFPPLRAGAAVGEVVQQSGDLYGRPVNLASRITGVARPGSVLVSEAARDLLEPDRWSFSDAGYKQLKGISGAVRLYRVRPARGDGGD